MPKRRCGMHCRSAGLHAVLDMRPRADERKRHPADGAPVEIITNRFGGVLVRVTKDYGMYSCHSLLTVRPDEVLTGALADLKRSMK